MIGLWASEEAAFEGDGEGVECGLPAVHPSFLAGAFRVERSDDEVNAFDRRLFVREVTSRSGRLRILAFNDSMAFVE